MARSWYRFQDYIKEDDALSLDANAFLVCEDCCEARECYYCHQDPIPRRILSCGSCSTSRCRDCSEKKFTNLSMSPDFQSTAQHIMGEVARGASLSSEVVGELVHLERENTVGAISICSTCKVCCCTTCMDDSAMESAARAMVSMLVAGSIKPAYQCSRCYWSAKPCTNPSCPNEVGVPTKRCGDCHIDRYCSVECQAAAYPDHIGRCKKIVAKRDAAAAKSGGGEME
jgi:hypothetical protein